MVSGAGLSATYGGYQAARKADTQIEQGDIANEQARVAQKGQALAGEALPILQQMLLPGDTSPQPPAPGQSSQPMQRGPQPQMLGAPPPPSDPTWSVGASAGAPPPPQQASAGPASFADRFAGANPRPAPAAPPQQAQQQPPQQPPAGQPDQQTGRFNLPTIMAAVVKAGHAKGATPAEMMAAITHLLPSATAQGQLDYKTLMAQMAGVRAETGRMNAENNQTYKAERLDQIDRGLNQRDTHEARLERGLNYRMLRDSLNRDQKGQELEARRAEAERRGDLAATRAVIDAQHKRALEFIQSGRTATGTIPDEDKAKIRKEADEAYNREILKLKGMQRGGAKPAAQAPAQAPTAAPGAPVKVATPQEAQALKPGTPYITPDGQQYTR